MDRRQFLQLTGCATMALVAQGRIVSAEPAKDTRREVAYYKKLDDGTYFGEIPGLRGVWANSKNLEDCREELRSALEDWVLFKLKDGDSIPGLSIGMDRRQLARTPAHAK